MTGFYCGICKESIDEVEANIWSINYWICDSCLKTVKEDEEIDEEPQMDYYPDVFGDN